MSGIEIYRRYIRHENRQLLVKFKFPPWIGSYAQNLRCFFRSSKNEDGTISKRPNIPLFKFVFATIFFNQISLEIMMDRIDDIKRIIVNKIEILQNYPRI